MELKLNIEYQELIELIKQLSPTQISKLSKEVGTLASQKGPGNEENTLQKLLLNGPVIDEVQYQEFLANRNYFNTWRTS